MQSGTAYAGNVNDFSLEGGIVRRVALFLFFFVWFVCGLAINSRNLDAFNLQHAGVEALVERHQFSLEASSTPQFELHLSYYPDGTPKADAFVRDGKQYAAKQPGEYMLGALVYAPLRLLGLKYSTHYTLTAAIVSFFTSSLMTALAAVVVFLTATLFTNKCTLLWPVLCSVVFAFGTTAFPYSGFAYHDPIASTFLVSAFYLAVLVKKTEISGRKAKLTAGGAGVLLGLTVTTSMLPFFMVCVVLIYFLWRGKFVVPLVVGGLAGITPLLFYNWRAFGNPFLQSNIAGRYTETAMHLDLQNMVTKAGYYFSEITLYDPITWVGIVGLAFLPRALKAERVVMCALFIAQAIPVLTIESHGGCHYGPRYLLPSLPYATLGVTGYYYLKDALMKRVALAAIVIVGAFSVTVNVPGALFSAMYCDVYKFAFWPAIGFIRNVGTRDFPLANWLILPALVAGVLFVHSLTSIRRDAQINAIT